LKGKAEKGGTERKKNVEENKTVVAPLKLRKERRLLRRLLRRKGGIQGEKKRTRGYIISRTSCWLHESNAKEERISKEASGATRNGALRGGENTFFYPSLKKKKKDEIRRWFNIGRWVFKD